MRRPSPTLTNRLCYAAALLYMIAFIPWSLQKWTVDYGDFPQFYMGGVIARAGAWEDLYPTPDPQSLNNPGMPEDSTMRPRYAALAAERGVGDRQRFIQSPPAALFYSPLAHFKYPRAYRLWIYMMTAATWVAAVLAGHFLQTLLGRPTRLAGALVLLIAASPLVYYGVRQSNVCGAMAMYCGLAIAGMIVPSPSRRHDAATAAATALGAFAKYATVVLIPILVATRRLRAFNLLIGLGIAVLVVSLAVAGLAPFKTYFREISPTLGRPHQYSANQSLHAVLLRLTNRTTLPRPATLALNTVSLTVLAAVLFLIFRRKPDHWKNAANVIAAAAALLTWLLVFSPVVWPSYHLYLLPLWGWLAWQITQSKLRATLAGAAVALSFIPFPLTEWQWVINLGEPLNSHMLLATVLMLILAVIALTRPIPTGTPSHPVHTRI
jgi:hypothetical protein